MLCQRLIWPLLALILMLSASASQAPYSDHEAVVELTAENFNKLVVQSDGVAMVHFFAPLNEQCKALAPKLAAAAKNLKGLALVGAVDCTNRDTVGNLCSRFGVRSFPTIKLFGSDRTKNPYTGELAKDPTDYVGAAAAKALSDAVTALLTDVHISRLGSREEVAEFSDKATKAGKAQVLLFTDKAGATSLYKALSTQLRRGLAFGQVHAASAPELAAEYGVKAFPALVVVKTDGGREPYSGELKAPALLAFLSGFSSEPPVSEAEEGGQEGGQKGGFGKKKAEAWAFVRQLEGVGELGDIDSREDMALLAVHGSAGEDGCKFAREMFLTAAGEMQAVVDTVLVSAPAADLEEGSEGARLLRRLGVDTAALLEDPCELQVVLLPFGKEKDESPKYEGAPDGKSLQRWVTDEVPFSLVSELDDATGSAFLFSDPSNGRMPMSPKVLLFTNKDEAPGVYRALAMALRSRGNLVFGWVQVGRPTTKITVDTFKPTKIPSLMVVLPTPEPGAEGEPSQMRLAMQPYFGPLKYGPMRQFLESIAQQVEMASGVVNDEALVRKALPQITNQSEFESVCTGFAGMCLLGLLDASAPNFEEERKELLSLALQQVNGGSGALQFAWLDAPKHRSIMKAFGVLSSDVPTLVALSSRRMRYAVLPGPSKDVSGPPLRLKAEAVGRFINDVLGAKFRTEPLQALPQIRDGDEALADDGDVAYGNGGAGASAGGSEEAPLEEEFDLTDILSEEVEGGAVAAGRADRLRDVEEQLKAEEEARKAAESAAKGASSKKKSKKKKKGKKSKASASDEL